MFLAYINGANQLVVIKGLEMVTVDDEGVIFLKYMVDVVRKPPSFILKNDYKYFTVSED